MIRKHDIAHWIAALALTLTALAASAHDSRYEQDPELRGSICPTSRGDRYRIVDAISLRRSIRRDLSRLPLHRERLGFMDTLIIVEQYETPIEPVLRSVEEHLKSQK